MNTCYNVVIRNFLICDHSYHIVIAMMELKVMNVCTNEGAPGGAMTIGTYNATPRG